MKQIFTVCILALYLHFTHAQSDEMIIKNIYQEELSKSPIYDDLKYLSKGIGHRINGSPELATAVEYAKQLMMRNQLDTVYLQPVMVPNWKREKNEIVHVINSPSVGTRKLNCIALGNSIGTGSDGLIGEIIEIDGVEELLKMNKELIKGKIVFFNQHFDRSLHNILEGYSKVINQRLSGTSEASDKGAIAVIVRSITPENSDSPHTGSMVYKQGVRKIPAVAISTNDADFLSTLLKREPKTQVYIELHCDTQDDAIAYNVIGELKGSQYPNQIILVGGHLDSWDVGEGAHDDGAGCVQSIEVLRIFNALNIEPRHTLRVVLWVNEENGVSGGSTYAENSMLNNQIHIAAIESDMGGFLPLGFFYDTDNDSALSKLISWKKYFEPYQVSYLKSGLPVFDIVPLKDDKILLLGLMANLQKYSTLYHSDKDVFEAVDKRELELGAAAMTAMIYLIDKYGIE